MTINGAATNVLAGLRKAGRPTYSNGAIKRGAGMNALVPEYGSDDDADLAQDLEIERARLESAQETIRRMREKLEAVARAESWGDAQGMVDAILAETAPEKGEG